VALAIIYLTMSLWLYLQAKCNAVCPFLFTDCSEYPCSCSARNWKKVGIAGVRRTPNIYTHLEFHLVIDYINIWNS